MYVLNFNPSCQALQSPLLSNKSSFTLQDLCPYMTQSIELKAQEDFDSMPVISWQLAMQIQDCRKKHPALKAFRLEALEERNGFSGGPGRIESFNKKKPGKLILMTANLTRGLSDMILLQPIMRAQAATLKKLGWQDKFSVSGSSGFRDLFYGQAFCSEFLPEIPAFKEFRQFDYFMDYGISLDRMKSLIGIVEWEEIDLRVVLKLPSHAASESRKRFPSDRPKIFLHWEAFDKQRTLPFDWFKPIVENFDEVEFYCALYGNPDGGEIYSGGPVNLWPAEKSLSDLFVTLKSMDVVVTTNTGIAHAAAAVGTPTIVIFTGRLYGWGDYWPRQHNRLYPSMQTIGLEENLTLTPAEIQRQMMQKLKALIPKRELAAA